MASGQMYLFSDRRFSPMLITQACGCFNDNLLKNSVLMLITYKTAFFNTSLPSPLLIALANMIFMLPYIIFAGLAGQIADKFDKARIVQIVKATEIFIVALSIYGFLQNDLILLMVCIGLMGIHSTFFGPIKYSILPEHLKRDELISANGYVEATTFITILIGTQLGVFAVNGVTVVLVIMFLIAIGGFVSSLYILPSTTISSEIKLNKNLFQESWEILKYSASKKQVFLAIMGISWFWFVGAAFLAQIPVLTKDVFWADQYVANLFFATFTIGVCIGSFLCSRIFGNEIQTKYVFLSSILLSVFGIDLFFASRISEVTFHSEELRTLSMFLSKVHNWRILVDLFLIAVLAGLYIVPLYALMQCFSSPAYRSRVIAANNIINAIFMVASNILITVLVIAGSSVTTIIFIVCFLNIVVSFFIYHMIPENQIIPEPLLRKMFKFTFDKLYKVEVRGIENFHKAGKRAVVIANHLSYLDPALLAVYLPERLSFAINTFVSREWWIRPFLKVVKTYPLDPNNPMAMKNLISEVKKNKKIAIFPEGRISTTGSLMKIYEGPGMIADKADANILPIRVDGTQFTFFSKVKHALKNKYFPKITITILPPVKLEAAEGLDNRERRRYLSQKVYDIMSDMIFESSDYKKPLFSSLIESSKTYGFKYPIAMDLENSGINYRQFLARTFILGGLFEKYTSEKENVGLMLPNSCATSISFFALTGTNRVPTMVNFSMGAATIISACKTAKVKTIFTSRRFVEKAELSSVIEKISEHFNVVYLEDLRQKLSIFGKLKGLISSYIPDIAYSKYEKNQTSEDLAVILFTSGTEGNPKAVAISHKNAQANRYQMLSRIDFGTTDLAFNALPMFHCFGLLASVLTVLSGVRTFFYPSPLHYRIIPEVIYDIGATIMFGTDTFLNGYAKHADPYDFYSVRYAFAGAEKLKPETRNLWFNKFGVRIFEGYGVTEASPVIAVNTPMHDMPGSVGRAIPKIETILLPVEGIAEGGRLCVKGPNIMMGYIHHDNPGVIIPPEVEKLGKGWYDTGDVVTINTEGYIKIQGRAKRFAKIAGEMVSLSSVEEIANQIDSRSLHAAIHLEDDKKGEQIILYTESTKVNRESFIEAIRSQMKTELLIPKIIEKISEVPVLPTGKINYRKLIEMAEKARSIE
jgi:acyl-[acyl-carrier-protein]-phospholipid O-acyltransferase/long-chain-fatty-acid--[acyl-carrier-protein] ligase